MESRKETINNKKYKVCLLGASLDNGNLGVQALAASLIKIILDVKQNAEIYLIYGNRRGISYDELNVNGRVVRVNIINYRLSPRAKIHEHLLWLLFIAFLQRHIPSVAIRRWIISSNPILEVLSSADFIGDIRGGDSFSDIYGKRGFVMGLLPLTIVFLLRKNLTLLPQTYGPFNSRISAYLARFVFMNATSIYARDQESLDLLHELLPGCKAKDLYLCPDVGFVLEPILPDSSVISPGLTQSEESAIIGLNVSGLLYHGGFTMDNMFDLKIDYKKFTCDLIDEIITKTNAHILLIPHINCGDNWCVESDAFACRSVYEMKGGQSNRRLHLVDYKLNQNEVKGVIGMCNFFIGARMHSCIAALSQGIPAIGIAYSRKFVGVFSTIDNDDMVINATAVDRETAMKTIMRCYENRVSRRQTLQQSVVDAKQRIRDCFARMMSAA